jgi:hypothetical protein
MSNLDAVKKVMMYQKDKSGFVKEPTVKEMADLVVLVLSQVKVIEQAIKEGRLDGKTPIKDVDYVSKDSAIKMLTKAVNDALSNEEDKFISRVEGKFDSKVYQSEKKRDDVVSGAIDRINTKLSEVKDGVVTEAEIRRAANLALSMIELPDFSELIKENIDGESVRNALSRLTEDKRYKVEISDVNGLAQAIAQVSQIRGQGGTIGKQQVYNFIRQAIADGTISGSGMGDMLAAVYDPANKAEQVLTTGDIGVSVQPAGSYLTSSNIVATITNGVTTNAPSEDAVFDALALKADLASPTFTGTVVLPNSQALVTPVLGTPTSGTLTNCTGLPVNGIVDDTSSALGVGTLELGHASDTTLSRSAAGVLAVEGVVLPSISSTNTLTNKRVTRRVTTTNAPGATPTTNTDNVDVMNFTGLGTAITSMTTNLSGTPADGDLIMFRFTDDGTGRAITWGASFAATTVALPTTTVASTMLRVGFQYSGSTWKCIATA